MTVESLARGLDGVREEFPGGRGYLAACTVGLASRGTRVAVMNDLDASARGRPDVASYSAAVEQSRAHFATLARVTADRVAIGSQASVFAGLVAGALSDGAEVLCAEGDFSSIVLPFVHAGRGIRVRTAPLEHLADAVTPATALVTFSLVQSATGAVADGEAIAAAARRHGALTLCDATQAIGWLPVDATMFDAVVCHAYKWLCAPRGVAFAAFSDALQDRMRPLFAGWYAGADPWTSCYGHEVELAGDATRFDVSPAWQAFVGAEPVLALFAGLDASTVHDHAVGLATAFRQRLGLDASGSAIVTWEDPDGVDLGRMLRAGLTASGRAGRARVAFHLFNDEEDVELAARALGR